MLTICNTKFFFSFPLCQTHRTGCCAGYLLVSTSPSSLTHAPTARPGHLSCLQLWMLSCTWLNYLQHSKLLPGPSRNVFRLSEQRRIELSCRVISLQASVRLQLKQVKPISLSKSLLCVRCFLLKSKLGWTLLLNSFQVFHAGRSPAVRSLLTPALPAQVKLSYWL